MFTDLLLIVLLIMLGWYWSDAMRAREDALAAVIAHCQKMEVQLLDEYVALNGFWFKRDGSGKLKSWRSYLFEFTATGQDRFNGKIVLLGRRVVSIQMEPYRI